MPVSAGSWLDLMSAASWLLTNRLWLGLSLPGWSRSHLSIVCQDACFSWLATYSTNTSWKVRLHQDAGDSWSRWKTVDASSDDAFIMFISFVIYLKLCLLSWQIDGISCKWCYNCCRELDTFYCCLHSKSLILVLLMISSSKSSKFISVTCSYYTSTCIKHPENGKSKWKWNDLITNAELVSECTCRMHFLAWNEFGHPI